MGVFVSHVLHDRRIEFGEVHMVAPPGRSLANGNILLGNDNDDMINEYSPDGKLIGETKLPKKYRFVRRK